MRLKRDHAEEISAPFGGLKAVFKNDVPPQGEEGRDRRREPRYATHDPVDVEVAQGAIQRVAAVVRDVSRSGLLLELDSALGKGVQVKITFPQELIIFGEVRYCRRSGAAFRAGILIADVFHSRRTSDEHIEDNELGRYLRGNGLTASEIIRTRQHLAHCEPCRMRLIGASSARMRPEDVA